MSTAAPAPLREKLFTRRTTLAAHEYHKNFHKVDIAIIEAVTSPEADHVTPLMSKIYLRLVNAPRQYWEQRGVLHFTARVKEGKLVKASAVLSDYLGVARATAAKALQWMHAEGVIGYFAGKNGVGIRVFLNHALSSIGTRPTPDGQKILRFPRGSSGERLGSRDEPAFKEPFGCSDDSDTDLNPRAPKSGAGQDPCDPVRAQRVPPAAAAAAIRSDACPPAGLCPATAATSRPSAAAAAAVVPGAAPGLPVEEIVARLRRELDASVKAAATRAAAREHERTREWLDRHGIPKAARVAQREAFDVLRSHGVIDQARARARAELEVGRATGGGDGAHGTDRGGGPRPPGVAATAAAASPPPPPPPPLTPEQIAELASACVALCEVQGKTVDETLRAISAGAGGWVPPGDVAKVRAAAHALSPELAERRHAPAVGAPNQDPLRHNRAGDACLG